MKGHPTLRINFDTQRVLKRLDEKHFLERKRRQHKANIKKWNLDMKKKITNIFKVSNSAMEKKKRSKAEPTKTDVEGEELLDNTPKDTFDDSLRERVQGPK